jgi:metal-sulfur cluster biosynthetic enzyme
MPKVASKKSIEEQVREKLHLVLDPELGISIVELGLIYGIAVDSEGKCTITMTLTTMGCPLFGQIQKEIEDRVMELDMIEDVETTLTFDPPWTIEKMTPEAKIQLGLD